MSTVTVSAEFQVVIPRRIREAMELVPVRPLSEVRGLFAGIETDVEREPDRV